MEEGILMCNVIGYSSEDQFERIILGGVSYEDALDFMERYNGVYVDATGFNWYLQIVSTF
jgi:hypothetical protein